MVTTKQKENPVWLVCQSCSFGMHCEDILDAHEIAKRHMDSYGCKGVDFFYQLSEYREAMSKKSPPNLGEPYYHNQRHHRSDTTRGRKPRRLF